jgi:hypothetical protein
VVILGSILEAPLPEGIEAGLVNLTELVAMAIATAESRAELARLADEQAALRRVATLVAGGALPEAVFEAVLDEHGRLLEVDLVSICRYEGDRAVTWVANWAGPTSTFPWEPAGRWGGGTSPRWCSRPAVPPGWTLVAGGTPPEKVFAAVTEEIGRLFGVDWSNMARYEPDGAVSFVATEQAGGAFSRWQPGGPSRAEPRHARIRDPSSGPARQL